MLRRYRAAGADLPFGDLRRAHGVAMEGHFWRFTDPAARRVVVALCGINRAADGRWANVALAAHPGGSIRERCVDVAAADERTFRAWAAGGAFQADADGVRVDLGHDAQLDVRLRDVRPWPRRAFGGLGIAHALPGLGQYWHPHVLGGRAEGTARINGQVLDLDGAEVYAEKNWGRGFPPRWWWAQAQAFDAGDACVALAGGDVTLGPVTVEATAVVVRLDGEVIRLGHPLASPVRARFADRRWQLSGRGPRYAVEIEAEPGAAGPHRLPVPLPADRRTIPAAHQHLAGRLAIVVRRRSAVRFAGESTLAGLERGALSPGR